MKSDKISMFQEPWFEEKLIDELIELVVNAIKEATEGVRRRRCW